MRRRHLRLPSSSDEDDGDNTVPSNPNPNPNPNPRSIPASDCPLVISDDEFVDVFDSLSDPSPPPPPPPNTSEGSAAENRRDPSVEPMSSDYESIAPIDEFLRKLGLRLRLEWLASCIAGLEGSIPGFGASDVAKKSKMCFEQFLISDINYSGAGILPANVQAMHKAELEGPFVLQVDEIVNISSHLRERYGDAPAGFKRCLKLSMTDGIQRVFGMEYKPIRQLEVLAPGGFKIVVRNVQIRRGLLMLVPEVLEILGGLVENLEAARQRLVVEVNKPARSKRKRGALPLSNRVSLAAWSSITTDNDAGAQANTSVPQSVNSRRPVAEAAVMANESDNFDTRGRVTGEVITQHIEGSTVEEFAPTHIQGNIVEEPISVNRRPISEPITAFGTTSERFTHQYIGRNISEDFSATPIRVSTVDKPASASNRPAREPNTVSNSANVEYTHAVNTEDAVSEVKHPHILTVDKENPFTYLACLMAKWTTQKVITPSIQGKIKCFLTGVKGFQFKQRRKFELHVYVDDGSLISEVVIDHDVVQRGVGYSPGEVTSALSSSDKKVVTDMRESMKRFQLFLANFEGMMLVEINKKSPLPVALEMNHGCSAIDAWMLLRRL